MDHAQIAFSIPVRTGGGLLPRCHHAIAVVALASVVGLPACSTPSPPPPSGPVTLHIGVALPKFPGDVAGVQSFIGNLLRESLLGMGWDGRPFGRLASDDWKWSDDALELTLRIRKDLKFHDGTPIDAPFVVQHIKGLLKSPTAVSYGSITAVEPVNDDPLAIKIKLSRPEALLLSELSLPWVAHPKDADIGVGPYRLLERKPRAKLAAFDGYYRGRPRMDFIEVQEYDEQRSSWAALMRSEIDAVHEITPTAIDFIQAEGQTSVRTFPFTRPYYIQLVFNPKHPVLKNPLVRQALSYGVDRQAIIDFGLAKQGMVAEGPIWPFHWAYSTAQKTYTYNTEAATLRLDAAGLKMKSSPGKMPSRLRFKCITLEKDGRYEKMSMILQKQLYAIGVDMEIEALPLPQLGARMAKGDFDAILAERTSGRSLFFTYTSFHSSRDSLGYAAADKVLDRLRGTTTDADVRAAVGDFQQILHDDPPAIYIAWPKVARVVSKKFDVPGDKERDIIPDIWMWKPVSSSQ